MYPSIRDQEQATAVMRVLTGAKETTLYFSSDDACLGDVPIRICVLIAYLDSLINAPTSSNDIVKCARLFRHDVLTRFGYSFVCDLDTEYCDVPLELICALIVPGSWRFVAMNVRLCVSSRTYLPTFRALEMIVGGQQNRDHLFEAFVDDAITCYANLRHSKETSRDAQVVKLTTDTLRELLSQPDLGTRLRDNGIDSLAYYKALSGGVASWLTPDEKAYKDLFAFIAPYIRLLMSIPAGSVNSERVFSSAAFIQQGRESLSVATFEKLVLTRDYLKRRSPEQLIADFNSFVD